MDNPGAGWHPDPTGKHQVRYHDGQQWTAHVSTDGRQTSDPMPGTTGPVPAPPAGGGAKGKGGRWKWAAGAIAALVVIVAIAGGSSDSSDHGSTTGTTSSTSTPSAAKDAEEGSAGSGADDGCGTKASSDCTPHLAADGVVRVDALLWRVRSARVTRTIGDQTYGLGAKANGRFLVVKVAVHSERDESVTLTDSTIKLEVDGNTYDPDLDGTVAAAGTSDEPFFLESLGPDSDDAGTVVFDVPAAVLKKPNIEVRFNELGFGDGHGYIALPPFSGGS